MPFFGSFFGGKKNENTGKDEGNLLKKVEVATSEHATECNWALFTEISDAVNSDKPAAHRVAACIKRRIFHKSPATVYWSLMLLDNLIKNGTDDIVRIVHDGTYLGDLCAITTAPEKPIEKRGLLDVENFDTKGKAAGMIRLWAQQTAWFKRYPNFLKTYCNLRKKGLVFPDVDKSEVITLKSAVSAPSAPSRSQPRASSAPRQRARQSESSAGPQEGTEQFEAEFTRRPFGFAVQRDENGRTFATWDWKVGQYYLTHINNHRIEGNGHDVIVSMLKTSILPMRIRFQLKREEPVSQSASANVKFSMDKMEQDLTYVVNMLCLAHDMLKQANANTLQTDDSLGQIIANLRGCQKRFEALLTECNNIKVIDTVFLVNDQVAVTVGWYKAIRSNKPAPKDVKKLVSNSSLLEKIEKMAASDNAQEEAEEKIDSVPAADFDDAEMKLALEMSKQQQALEEQTAIKVSPTKSNDLNADLSIKIPDSSQASGGGHGSSMFSMFDDLEIQTSTPDSEAFEQSFGLGTCQQSSIKSNDAMQQTMSQAFEGFGICEEVPTQEFQPDTTAPCPNNARRRGSKNDDALFDADGALRERVDFFDTNAKVTMTCAE